MTENEIMMKAEHYRGQIGKDICVDTELFHEMIDLINRKNEEADRFAYYFENAVYEKLKPARAEAIKEFAERVKFDFDKHLYGYDIIEAKIDQIAKEMGVEL